jgi:hypothetical protein
MLSLALLFWITIAIALVSFWWHSDRIKALALAHVYRYCKDTGLQLLDQTMVLRGVWPVRNESGLLVMRRKYNFEFTSTGESRYEGLIVMCGLKVLSLELEAHLYPLDNDSPQ